MAPLPKSPRSKDPYNIGVSLIYHGRAAGRASELAFQARITTDPDDVAHLRKYARRYAALARKKWAEACQ